MGRPRYTGQPWWRAGWPGGRWSGYTGQPLGAVGRLRLEVQEEVVTKSLGISSLAGGQAARLKVIDHGEMFMISTLINVVLA